MNDGQRGELRRALAQQTKPNCIEFAVWQRERAEEAERQYAIHIAEHRRLQDAADRLRAGLEEAIDMIVDWDAYADDYFREKWDIDGDLAKLRALLAVPSSEPPMMACGHRADALVGADWRCTIDGVDRLAAPSTEQETQPDA